MLDVLHPTSRLLVCVVAMLMAACGDDATSLPTDAGTPDAGDGGMRAPRVPPSDPCQVAGYRFEEALDCDVVRCPVLTCTCTPDGDAGVAALGTEHTLSACAPGAGCLTQVDCDRICDPTLVRVREVCDARLMATTSQRCAGDGDCIGECRAESAGAFCVDRFPCAEHGHCGHGSQCLFGPDVDSSSVPPFLGQCTDGSPQSFCYEDSHCATGRCLHGQCTRGADGDACTAARHCASGFCRVWGAAGSEGQCVSGQRGGDCGDDDDCDDSLHCVHGVCRGSEVGEPCELSTQCASGACVSGRCESGILGARCEAGGDCEAGFCVSGRCTSGGLLAPCAQSDDCESGLHCASGRCSDGSQGMPCSTVDQCSVLACVRNACSEGANGATCLTDDQCMSQRCANPAGATPGECTSGQPGAICVSGVNCVSGSCTRGFCN